MAEGARLESVYTATYREFESLTHRHIRKGLIYQAFFISALKQCISEVHKRVLKTFSANQLIQSSPYCLRQLLLVLEVIFTTSHASFVVSPRSIS